MARSDWLDVGPFLAIAVAAVALTAWQTRVDGSVFEPYFGDLPPVAVMAGATAVGAAAIGYLGAGRGFAMIGPGSPEAALRTLVVGVPIFAVAAVVADVVVRFPEDTNVALPDALRFYPAVAVFVEAVLHAAPVALLVAVLGRPAGLDANFWWIAIPVALIEAVAQAVYADSVGTAVFSAVQLVAFGVVEVWTFWRFGFVWMLAFRLAYYLLWHVVWGAVRLELLF